MAIVFSYCSLVSFANKFAIYVDNISMKFDSIDALNAGPCAPKAHIQRRNKFNLSVPCLSFHFYLVLTLYCNTESAIYAFFIS